MLIDQIRLETYTLMLNFSLPFCSSPFGEAIKKKSNMTSIQSKRCIERKIILINVVVKR